MESEENKHEIILSKETKSLTIFSSTGLISRGQKLADLVLLKSPLLTKIEGILLAKFSEISHKNEKYPLYLKIELAIALLEIRNKSTETWAINILNEEQEKPEEEGYQDSILRQKNQLLQVISKLGKHKTVSEYILGKIKTSWDGTNFLDLFGWSFIFFSDNQMDELIELFSNADDISKIKIIETFRNSGRKQEKIISYLQGIAQNDAKVWLKIMACDALINLGQTIVAKNALIPILRDKSPFNEDARILLALIENNKEKSAQAIKILREKIQKETSIYWLQKYISYLSKLGEKELAVSLLLDVLTSLVVCSISNLT
ncbi:MAG: hypothetical protein HY863_07140 [Chloroflexi bacterium]|nr:hypothetical protein [Chloroflexota bacterium]